MKELKIDFSMTFSLPNAEYKKSKKEIEEYAQEFIDGIDLCKELRSASCKVTLPDFDGIIEKFEEYKNGKTQS